MLINPYKDTKNKKQYKGDIHFHTNLSDGVFSPDAMFYRLIKCGFDFCAPADHDIIGAPGTYNGLVILKNQEMSSNKGHVVALNSNAVRKEAWGIAEQIESIRKNGGMAILSHPKIREFISDQSLTYTADRLINELNLKFDGIEVFTRNVGSGFKCAIDRLDVVWTALIDNPDFKPVWGFASSDGHHIDHITKNTGIMVWSPNLTSEELLNAISTGRFYSIADTQARFKDITFDGVKLKVSAVNCKMIKLIMQGGEIAACFYSQNDMCSINYQVTGKEGYLRAEAYDSYGKAAYSNPIKIPRGK